MATALYVLMVWFLASVPFALFIGRLCSLNHSTKLRAAEPENIDIAPPVRVSSEFVSAH